MFWWLGVRSLAMCYGPDLSGPCLPFPSSFAPTGLAKIARGKRSVAPGTDVPQQHQALKGRAKFDPKSMSVGETSLPVIIRISSFPECLRCFFLPLLNPGSSRFPWCLAALVVRCLLFLFFFFFYPRFLWLLSSVPSVFVPIYRDAPSTVKEPLVLSPHPAWAAPPDSRAHLCSLEISPLPP
jgi:hypothetical protein